MHLLGLFPESILVEEKILSDYTLEFILVTANILLESIKFDSSRLNVSKKYKI